MDDEKKKKKKKKRRREETEEREQEAASLPLSHGLQISALSSPVDDAAALQKRNGKKARKLLHFQHQDARTGDDPAEKPLKTQSGLQLEGLQNHHLQDERPRKRNATEHTEDQDIHEGELHIDIAGKIKKKKKKKKRNNMDAYVSLHREIEQQQEDQHSQEENLHTENNKGEKKSSKKKEKKKREDDGDPHSEEGNPPNKGEEKRSKKKKEKRRKEEKAETPSQKITTESSCGDHELRKEKKARKLAKENGMDGDVFEGVENANNKMAKKAKHTQDTLCKSGGEVGSNGHVKGDKSASSKARKHSKESRKSVESGGYDPTSNEDHDLLRNNIECSKKPLAEQLEHVTNTIVTIDPCPREKEKGKKKERKSKRVTFQDQINVTDQQHVRDISNAASENSMEIVEEVWGVRFTAEEDEILKDAVWKFIKSKGWDEQEGLNKVFHSMKHKDARNCWADINLSLPHRPRPAIRYRAHLLLEKGAHAGKWSEEEEQLLNRLQGEHGHKWKEISALLDRHRTSIKEKWRTLKRMKGKGVWTQGELQQLSDMVHKCLRAKASIPVENRKTDHRILRDDINWEKIADTIGTHNHGSCCGKWYYNLQSSLVTDGLWANEDDLLLLQSLLESGACVEEEVEWDSLLNHRSGQVCLMRWKQMVKHLGENRARQFSEKLDILALRYAPELLESSIEISIENSSIKEDPRGSAKIRD